MDLYTKREYAKRHIDSIATHDDAPLGAVEETIGQLIVYAEEQLEAARVRRAEKIEQAEMRDAAKLTVLD